MMQAAIAADSRLYNVFTFLEDESLDDGVTTSADHVVTTPAEVGGGAGIEAKQEDDGLGGDAGDDEAEPLVTAAAADSVGFVTSSPTKSSEDVADLEFRGND